MAIMIHPVEKLYFDGTHRSRSPEETYAAVEPLMAEIGVTEIVDVTPLDRLGIPVFTAVRPGAARGAARVHAGKGKEPIHARVSAMMEALERYCAEYRGDRMEYATYEEIGPGRAVHPEDLFVPRKLEQGEKLHWTPVWDILNDEEAYVPSNAVFHPYDSLGMAVPLFRSDSNGLASGNVMEEAILHALFEVIERDALSLAEQRHDLGHRLTIGNDCAAREVLDRFEENGIEIHLWLLDGKTGIPTVAAAADDTVTRDPAMIVIGSGTHACPEIAALRALTEVAQSRGSYLQGGRTDPQREMVIRKAGYERLKRINRMWFADAEAVDIRDIPDVSTNRFDLDIERALQEISPYADRVCVCDLSRTPVPVVRVVVPGFEVSYMDPDRKRPAQG
ncbi:MAG TPA: YcaO-related McrA-glycine thioamidation protein [Methanoculleus sp.]|jgi:ribosomal protein S12 methylthiotransferase accessory factor|uniref:YcaO-related McrA-glycine thioamidation protein n=1 Tax=Methanoculleus sp. TaxID=90427 RepID=UPI000B1D1DC6|nr:YcaO-related McrA-glycine thioamidation protein [Methanoculleus sp.]MBP7144998.1 YcaO-related McrA-glycine thioamidation protein [Methanoculleus sp.]HNQ34025.1 YcaO-related McrA-glycine thioamidation protein [Methanoculleus sp.]HOC83950.1 YcaO-related McrA-glycine thioamidation protein [Methanoculleus sp.]HOF95676.1 YcaO-related McrA-glycine thioamidation protein [Methanoculleus sp.]HOI61268.1 YcaO-related McrA-glycine thioamidation protein [Methanoculleus sp.]